ncbi:MAG: FG-GAP-like repeat-containing protein, partial [Vicinamibacterales bacterium]
MKRTLSLLAGLCLFAGVAGAEPVTTIRNNGSSATRVDLVILGDGYTAAEITSGKYASDVESAVIGFFAGSPYDDYRNYFNVHRIDVTSNESGADHDTPSIIRKDTALDSAYDCSGIQRLICSNTTKVNTVLTNSIASPNARDIILVLVNDPVYGGSGGSIAVASTNVSATELVLHETGHSFGLLADEYGGPAPPSCNSAVEPSEANATKQTTRSLIKWNAWIDAGTAVPTTSTTNAVPGLFAGAKYCDAGLSRPTYNSKMRSLNQAFHQVNSEQLVKRIYNFASPIDAATPTSTTFNIPSGTPQQFTVTTPSPVSHALTVQWKLDGNIVGSATSYLLSGSVASGVHTIELRVSDPTSLVRTDASSVLVAVRTWTVTVVGGGNSDVNGDGSPDLVWRNTGSGANVVWYLNGTTLVTQGALQTVADPAWQLIATADLNADNHPDAIWRNTTTGANVVWYLNGTAIQSQANLPPVTDLTWQLVASADVNRDGSPDLIWRNQVNGATLVWYLSGATLLTQASIPTVADLSWTIAASADMNADGNPDLLWRNVVTGANVVWYMNGVSIVSQGSLPTVADLAWTLAAALDVNSDGVAELFWRHRGTGANVVWSMSGVNVGSQVSLPSVPDTSWHIAGPTAAQIPSDVNGDQHPDLVWRNTSTGANVVWYLNGVTLVSQVSLPGVTDLTWQRVATADLNGDGHPDLIWRNNVTGANVVWLLNGTTLLSQVSLPSVPDLTWQLVTTADVNEDAKPDLIWRNTSTGANVVWYLNGTTFVTQVSLPSVVDLAWRIGAAADVNGDGHADLIWRNTSTGANVVWYLSGPTASILSQAALAPVADLGWQIALAADVNGDSHPD